MSEQNNNLNVFNLEFLNFKFSNNNYKINFKGVSENYEKSFIYGNYSLSLLNNSQTDTYNYVINVFVNTLKFTISGLVKNDSTYNNHYDLIKEMWKLIFINGRKKSNGTNTLQNNSSEENQYMCYLNSKLFDNENDKIYIFIENYKWPNNLISENNITEPLTPEPTSLPTSAPTQVPTSTPTPVPTSAPTPEPTSAPTQVPTSAPTELPENIEKYFPPEIIGKTYYFDLYDFANQINYISTFIYTKDKLTEIFYNDNTLQEYARFNEYPIDKFKYNTKNRTLVLEEKYSENQYIIPAAQQGVFLKKVTKIIFNDDFTTMTESDIYMEMYPPELVAFRPILLSNGWTISDDNTFTETQLKVHTLNLPGELKGTFPSQIIDKVFYAWVYDNINEQYYLSTYFFQKDKLTEVFYVDQTLTDYVQIFEYPASNSIFDSSKQQLSLEISFNSDQYIIPSNNQGRFRRKIKRVTFNQDFSTFTEVDRFLDMYLPEIVAFIPLITLLGWAWSEDDLWVEFSWLDEAEKFTQTIPEKPVFGQDTLDESNKLQCLNKGLINNFSTSKDDEGNDVIIFNNVPYPLNDHIGLSIGVYTIDNIPESIGLGFIIDNTSKFEILEGQEIGIRILDGLFIRHYYGKIRFEIKGDFGTISYHSYSNEYMGGKNRLKYVATC